MKRNDRRGQKIKSFNRNYHDKKFMKHLSFIIIILLVLLLCIAIFYQIVVKSPTITIKIVMTFYHNDVI